MSDVKPTIAILGGTGALGTGLARRWAQAGYPIIIGSRTADKAQVAVDELQAIMQERSIEAVSVIAADNKAAAAQADIVALTVPYAHHASTLEALKTELNGKILIDVTVPLRPPKVGTVQLPEAGSAAQEAQAILGEDVKVVSAFQNVAAHHLQEGHGIACDVLVAGNNKEARAQVVTLVEAAGMKGFSIGPIANSAAAEALTSILIQINRQFKCHAGIKITGLPEGK
ncbi:MAG: NADPH-dependent F420 reductase [Pseudomonadales bacterium]|nr:NADPH-dependent F420 reductase [Pseudomonadales bacterium]